MCSSQERPTRVLLNGCWDLCHAGHFNALLQVWQIAQQFPHGQVVAGIHANAEIARVKGGTFVYTDDEKRQMLEACRFVDAIVCDVPYRPVDEELIGNLNCDFAVHGSDQVILADGTDMYGPVKRAGKYFEIPRSENIATTDLIDRILFNRSRPFAGFTLSARRLHNFFHSAAQTPRTANFFVFGHFDLFHPGHVQILTRAKALCGESNQLIVGIIARPMVDVLTEGERLLALAACRFVDDVLICPTTNFTPEFVKAYGISTFVDIQNHPDFLGVDVDTCHLGDVEIRHVDCQDVLVNSEEIRNRILSKASIFIQRNIRKGMPCPTSHAF